MNEHEEKRVVETYIGTVVITYNPAIKCPYMGKIESHYTAVMVDSGVRYEGTGLIRQSALLDLFRKYASSQVPNTI